jgi:hypothetical protein
MTMPDLLVLKLRMMMIGVILAENCLEIHLNSLLHMGIERSFASETHFPNLRNLRKQPFRTDIVV